MYTRNIIGESEALTEKLELEAQKYAEEKLQLEVKIFLALEVYNLKSLCLQAFPS